MRAKVESKKGSIYINDFDKTLWNKFSGVAKILGLTLQEAVAQALNEWIEEHKKDTGL